MGGAPPPPLAYGLLPCSMELAGSRAALSQLGGSSSSSRIACIAQVPDFEQAFAQGFDEHGRACSGVLPKTRHAEDDVV